jgi:hypothetical protein
LFVCYIICFFFFFSVLVWGGRGGGRPPRHGDLVVVTFVAVFVAKRDSAYP